MNAKEFYEKFIAAMREENIATNEQIKKHLDQVGWTYKKIYRECESAFTELVNKGIVDRIIESEDGLIPQHEYLRIDSIGYNIDIRKFLKKKHEKWGLIGIFGNLQLQLNMRTVSMIGWMRSLSYCMYVVR